MIRGALIVLGLSRARGSGVTLTQFGDGLRDAMRTDQDLAHATLDWLADRAI